MSKLLDLLTDLALDSKKQSVFINNPNILIEEVGLSKAEQTAIASGEGTKITALFANEQIPLAVTTSDPGPDPLPDPDPFPPFPPEESEPDFE